MRPGAEKKVSPDWLNITVMNATTPQTRLYKIGTAPKSDDFSQVFRRKPWVAQCNIAGIFDLNCEEDNIKCKFIVYG